MSEAPNADGPPSPSSAPAQAPGARLADERQTEGAAQGNGKSVPPILVIAIAIVGGGYLMHWLARTGLFPANPKTLARDAAILGFIGGLCLVEQLVHELIEEPPRNLLLAINIAASLLVVLISKGLPLWVRLVTIVSVAVGTIQAVSASPARRKRAKMEPVVRYGAIGLGVALLVLALFLQLRSIDLSKS